ncbi:type VI secretion system tip protein VgrG, partial [Klebsiella sp. JN_Kp126]
DDAALSDAPAGERLTAAMKVFMDCIRQSGKTVEKLDKTLIDHHIAELDYQISRQLDAVMHHPEFQKVESLWRGLKQLVDSTDYRQNVKTEILDVSKDDLRQDFEDAPELIQSGLYWHTYTAEYDTPGGEPIGSVISAYEFITAMHSHARRDEDFGIRFDGIPDSPDFSFRPAPGSRPVMAGTLPARVTSTTENDTYGHIDKDGRYRVNMLFDRDSWETGFESLWVRQSRPYAGDTYGLHLPLLAGTEVAIGFEDGNPDRPYIAGVLHDSAHGDHVTIRNYKRNVLRTPANNKIRLDDERGKEHIKVSTEYGGKSQLNLGHLVDADKQKRGEGFELRTDSWGAIRAQKGIFISADGQAKAQGQVLDMEPAVSNLGDVREQMTSISDDAQKATANPADLQAQIKLLEQQLRDLKKSVLLMSAPDGMALTSGQHLQVSAGQNLIATAGKNADVSVVKKLFVGVGAQLSVFVRKLGMKLIANQGPVMVQAQNDMMELLARKEISIVSTEDEIKIIAKKKLTLNGGGSYITLDANGIESATQGEYRTKAGHYGRKERANKPEDFPNVAPETTEPSSKFSFS